MHALNKLDPTDPKAHEMEGRAIDIAQDLMSVCQAQAGKQPHVGIVACLIAAGTLTAYFQSKLSPEEYEEFKAGNIRNLNTITKLVEDMPNA